MDNHPIPQDVTGFKFRLIGDMTVKQFGYVAAGCIMGIIFLYLPIFILIKIPFIILFPAVGLAMAFVPVQGRPADAMASYFLSALLSPNQYVFHKSGVMLPVFDFNPNNRINLVHKTTHQDSISQQQLKRKKLASYLDTLHQNSHVPLDQKEASYIQNITGYINQIPTQPPIQAPIANQVPQSTPPSSNQIIHASVPQQTDTPMKPETPAQPSTPSEKPSTINVISSSSDQERVLIETEAKLKTDLAQAQAEEKFQTDNQKQSEAHIRVAEIENQLNAILAQKLVLENELAGLKSQTQKQTVDQPAPTSISSTVQAAAATSTAPVIQSQSITGGISPTQTHTGSARQLTEEEARAMGLPRLPDVPNLILGIVKDSRGNAISNILVEVKDKEGLPARAFRTNTLGQFASATPLTTGTYSISFEDPKNVHRFDPIELVAQGSILLPIEIISQDEREDLRKELFTN